MVDITGADTIAANQTSVIGYVLSSFTDSITAFAGGGQTSATQLKAAVNRISTCATAGDSVKLPSALQLVTGGTIGVSGTTQGASISILNQGVASCQVFGSGTDTINDVATATGVPQMPNSFVNYICPTNGKWFTSSSIGVGFSGFYPIFTSANAITAFAGGGQTSATPLTKVFNRVTVCATGGDSVKLATAVPGMFQMVTNQGANSCDVFPTTGGIINAIAADGAFAVAANKRALFTCSLAGSWDAILTA